MFDCCMSLYLLPGSFSDRHKFVAYTWTMFFFERMAICSLYYVGPIANLKGNYFQLSLSMSLSVCEQHFYPSTLTNFDETWSQGPYSDLVWPRP